MGTPPRWTDACWASFPCWSVLMHAVLVQRVAGTAVIAKTPTDGGLFSLTVVFGLARRCGLPVSLVSGAGGELGEALVRNASVDCLAFVGAAAAGARWRPACWTTTGGTCRRWRGERVRGVGVLGLDHAGEAAEEGIRLRQAALHRVRSLRGAAQAAPRVPGDVPSRAPLRPGGRSGGGGRAGRRPPGAELRSADQRAAPRESVCTAPFRTTSCFPSSAERIPIDSRFMLPSRTRPVRSQETLDERARGRPM